MAIIHEAYLFRPSDFARDILPYATALAQNPDGEKLLFDTLIERFENISSVSWLAMEYGGWDISYVYDAKYSFEKVADAHRGDRLDVGRLIVFMIYGYLHPVPSQLGLRGLWRLMEEVLTHPLGWHSSDTLQMLRSASEAEYGLCIITSG